MVKSKLKAREFLLLGIALFYLVVRFGFGQQLDNFGVYASYVFEILCVITALGVMAKGALTFFQKPTSQVFAIGAAAFAAGAAVYKFSGVLGISIPFDLKGAEVLFFLLIVAPILEELIFRFLLWAPLLQFKIKPVVILLITSILFSYSHLHSIWSLPADFHSFLIYQTAYTLPLGFACGYFVLRYSSLPAAILVHFTFNFGFYLGSLF